MVYSNLGMWSRVRALYLILLGGLSVQGGSSGMRGFKWEGKVLVLTARQVVSMWV